MRRRVLIAGLIALPAVVIAVTLALLLRTPAQAQAFRPAYWPTRGWLSAAPEEQGFDSRRLAEELRGLRDDGVPVHSLLIIRNGYVVLDATFHPFDKSIPHKLASVTKSFTTTLIGIAADRGELRLDQHLVSFFPGRAIAGLDERKRAVTVRHLAGMMNGMRSGCLSGDEPTLDAMRAEADWVQAALDRPMVKKPGTRFCYDSPGMHLLSAILQEATGMTALEYARRHLFAPLGIREAFWQTDPQGITRGWGDLFLKPRDAARLGYLWLCGGVWDGRQIVSPQWVTDAVTARTRAGEDDYGYGWWVSESSYFAAGSGGQIVRVYPGYGLIVVVTAGGVDYDRVEPVLVAALRDPKKPLPPDPAGEADLAAALAELAAPPGGALPRQAVPTPETARAVSGRTYLFDPNPVRLAWLRPEFRGADEAVLTLNVEGLERVWPAGLDGAYRGSSGGIALRGFWSDSRTFMLEVFEDGLSTYSLRFEGDVLELGLPELGVSLPGRAQSP